MKSCRFAYLSGPVDAEDVYVRWKNGEHTTLFGTSYLQQFYTLCRTMQAKALVFTTLPGQFYQRTIDDVTIVNRPPSTRSGIGYHLAMCWSLLALAPILLRFWPTAFIITACQNHWFMLAYVKVTGAQIIPSAHCTMWRPHVPTPAHWKVLLGLNAVFLRLFVRRAMAISHAAADQLRRLGGRLEVAVITPTYAIDHFTAIARPDHGHRPFRILFAGRTETNKGIFDLVEIATRLDRERPDEFLFDICGEGSQLDRLRAVAPRNMRVHGFCDRHRMDEFFSASHIVVVPTRRDFEEGLAKTCVEAVLAGRPFITSPVVPALDTLGEAAIAVPPEDNAAYHDAIVRLADDPTLYRRKQANCLPLQAQFYDTERSYGAILQRQLGGASLAGSASAKSRKWLRISRVEQ